LALNKYDTATMKPTSRTRAFFMSSDEDEAIANSSSRQRPSRRKRSCTCLSMIAVHVALGISVIGGTWIRYAFNERVVFSELSGRIRRDANTTADPSKPKGTVSINTPAIDAHKARRKRKVDNSTTVSSMSVTISEQTGHSSIISDARYADGRLGYVAPTKSLQQSVAKFQSKRVGDTYFDALASLIRHGDPMKPQNLDEASVCSLPGGEGEEMAEGFELLSQKIRVVNTTANETLPKILCLIYTHAKMKYLASAAALSWGYKCDGFLAFSTETDPELGMLDLLHAGEESYNNMWQKVRSIWAYIRKHYANDFDYFHLGGDDMYVLVENMRRFLNETESRKQTKDEPIFLGQWRKQKEGPAVAGGAGYTLNREALVRLVDKSLQSCLSQKVKSSEDTFLSICMRQLHIPVGDTRDYYTAEPKYHSVQPATIFKSKPPLGDKRPTFYQRIQSYHQTLKHPSKDEVVGPKYGLDAASEYSVTFHNMHNPLYFARVHAILYRLCPDASPLGRSLLSMTL
jgi:glycoprotein-N-acetylgalactosamine 3-beta-galactosyltransferase